MAWATSLERVPQTMRVGISSCASSSRVWRIWVHRSQWRRLLVVSGAIMSLTKAGRASNSLPPPQKSMTWPQA